MEELIQKIIPYLGDSKRRGNEIIPRYCPFCEGGTHKDKGTFAFNTETGVYNCLRGSCGESGHARQLADYLGIESSEYMKQDYFREVRKSKKTYKKPEVETQNLTREIIEYFSTRGISEKTLIKNKVTSKDGNIVFNYYQDGELTFVKYKIPRKPRVVNGKKEMKSWREADTKPILYGMDECDSKYPLIIIEGEPDKLVLDECGVKNATSIPSGTNDFSWIEECWDFLEKFDEIIIWADNDKAGKEFQQEVISRLEDWKLKIVKCEEKDANIVLFKHGKKKVKDYIEKAVTVSKQYITDLADVKRKDYRNQEAISTGFKQVDTLLGGFYGGQLVIWTGYNGSGKSTLLSNIIINGIGQHKTFAYSGELAKEDFKEWMDMQLLGKKYLSNYECPVKKQLIPIPNEKYYDLLDDFYQDRMFLFDSEDYATDNEVLKAMEYMAKREGVKVFLIDNLLTTPISGQGDPNEKQARYIIKLKKFARKFNAVVHLVAHPKKPQIGQTRVDKYSVSGTANITDLADRVMGVHKLTVKDKEKNPEYRGYSALLLVFKDRKFGVFDEEIKFKFEYYSKRFHTCKEELEREYSWTQKIKNEKLMEIREEFIVAPWDEV